MPGFHRPGIFSLLTLTAALIAVPAEG